MNRLAILFFVLLFGSSFSSAMAQTRPTLQDLDRAGPYCKVFMRNELARFTYTMALDLGTQRVRILDDNRLRDMEGKVMDFPSVVGALNFMAERGWEVVAAMDSDDGSECYLLKKTNFVQGGNENRRTY